MQARIGLDLGPPPAESPCMTMAGRGSGAAAWAPPGDADAAPWRQESFDSAENPLARLDLAGHFLDVNRAFSELIGRSLDDLRGRPFDALWSIRGEADVAAIIDRLATDGARNVEVTAAGPDVEVPDASVRFVMVRDAHGAGPQVGLQLITTAFLERQRSLSADPRGFELSFDQIEVGMVITGLDGVVARVNAAMGRLLDRRP